jgi:hypothetical protein
MSVIAPWKQTKYLTLSSFFFSVPALYSYYRYNMIYSPVLLCSVSLISANYWRNALYDWRRQLDIYMARSAFVYFIASGFYYLPPHVSVFVGIPSLYSIGYCFYKSHSEYEENKESNAWVFYHALFHSISTCNIIFILTKIGNNYAKLLVTEKD